MHAIISLKCIVQTLANVRQLTSLLRKSVPIRSLGSWEASCRLVGLSCVLNDGYIALLGRWKDVKNPRSLFSSLYVIALVKSLKRKKGCGLLSRTWTK